MQRKEDYTIILSCDFCGCDWDKIIPVIEGHKDSIICLDCIKSALENAKQASNFTYTTCLQEYSDNTRFRKHPDPTSSPGLNKNAVIYSSDIK